MRYQADHRHREVPLLRLLEEAEREEVADLPLRFRDADGQGRRGHLLPGGLILEQPCAYLRAVPVHDHQTAAGREQTGER
jgi:hypothetical protein